MVLDRSVPWTEELTEIKERLVPFMVSECGRHGVTRVYFMLTNIMEESTELLYYGEGSEEMAKCFSDGAGG